MARLTLWRVDPSVCQKAISSTTNGSIPIQRMGSIPVGYRSLFDNPELFYSDKEPHLLRWPPLSAEIQQLNFNRPLPDVQRHRNFDRQVQAARNANSTWGMPHVIQELPFSVVDPPLRKENWDDLNSIRVTRVRVVQQALRAEQTHANPWDIPGSAYGVSSCELLSEIQRHFLEPVVDNGLTWQLWEAAEVRAFLNLRIQRFLLETGIVRKEAQVAVSANQTSVEAPSDLLELRKVDFLDVSGVYTNLTRIDELQADNGNPGWEALPSSPQSYIEEPLPSLSLRLYPTPSVGGTLYVRYVPIPETVTAACTILPIPRMFSWALKWGVIADLLVKEGEANDPKRGQAAESQFTLGVNLARYLSGVEI